MSEYELIGTVRVEYDDDNIDPESGKENLRQMVQDGTLDLTIETNYHDEDETEE
jgi:hypothetical protein